MIPTIIIAILLIAYSIYVICKKIKQIKSGNYCSCGCDSCPSSSNCKSKK